MSLTTEQVRTEALCIDALPRLDAARLLASAQVEAANSIHSALPGVCDAAVIMACAIRSGHTLYYTAAGSSALMAAADAMELGGTFNIDSSQLRILMAGGIPTTAHMPNDAEDNTSALDEQLAMVQPGDVMLAVSASGNTPYTITAVRKAQEKGATVIGIANNANCGLLTLAEHAIFLETPAEVIAGSTRLGAATAQKIALNTMSSLMALELGHVYSGLMVNVRVDNNKLRERAHNIVVKAAGTTDEKAFNALTEAYGNVKLAVLLAAGAASKELALSLLKDSNGHLRAALSRLNFHRNNSYTSGES